jgi:hypothetical protein
VTQIRSPPSPHTLRREKPPVLWNFSRGWLAGALIEKSTMDGSIVKPHCRVPLQTIEGSIMLTAGRVRITRYFMAEMEGPIQPLEFIFSQIGIALDKELFYLALLTTLTIPDVCAGLESESSWTKPEKYICWYDQYVCPNYRHLTGEDCYRLRCGVAHQGKMDHPKFQYDRTLLSNNLRISTAQVIERK